METCDSQSNNMFDWRETASVVDLIGSYERSTDITSIAIYKSSWSRSDPPNNHHNEITG
ncbi:hypothetical protein SOASR014_45810 [Pectobacterium carotovorum subsp. carotovorum]|nr:hypothetical protein SOASR014_45810 [Pectobacterium carotovorum subsp. carotovorum]GLX46904.1 hypothetical protein Pcaca01_45720 [Pectobacterium carotovorum subsp. carotovorum]